MPLPSRSASTCPPGALGHALASRAGHEQAGRAEARAGIDGCGRAARDGLANAAETGREGTPIPGEDLYNAAGTYLATARSVIVFERVG